ncbi:MAG: hypothetical protein ABSF61_00155 [Anaerolineales bacterium]|jgi:hypothetical protein
MSLLYGGGAILIRELALRWGKGWRTVFLLGMTFGIVEEGLMVKSRFDINWPDAKALGQYGRWEGINWVWATHLTLYHMVFSIAIPIVLVTLMFPERRRDAWIGQKGFYILAGLFGADVVFGFLFLASYRPPLLPYLLAAGMAGALFWLAGRQPGGTLIRDPRGQFTHPGRLYLLGLASTLALFGIGWRLAAARIPAWLVVLLLGGCGAPTFGVASHLSRGSSLLLPRNQLGLASGALSSFIALAPLQQLDKTRTDNTSGMAWVGLAAALMLVWLALRVRQEEKTAVLLRAP